MPKRPRFSGLARARKRAGLTQRALGKLTRIPCSRIGEFELGRYQPRLDDAAKIAAALGCRPVDIWPELAVLRPGEAGPA